MKPSDIREGVQYPAKLAGRPPLLVTHVARPREGETVPAFVRYVREGNAANVVSAADFCELARLPDEAAYVLMPAQCPDDALSAILAANPRMTADQVLSLYAKAVRVVGIAPGNPPPMRFEATADDASDPLADFLCEVYDEANRAATLFPGDTLRTLAFAEEAGELVKAVLDESPERVRREAVQAAAMAARIVLDGDGAVAEWRKAKGVAPL